MPYCGVCYMNRPNPETQEQWETAIREQERQQVLVDRQQQAQAQWYQQQQQQQAPTRAQQEEEEERQGRIRMHQAIEEDQRH